MAMSVLIAFVTPSLEPPSLPLPPCMSPPPPSKQWRPLAGQISICRLLSPACSLRLSLTASHVALHQQEDAGGGEGVVLTRMEVGREAGGGEGGSGYF